MHYSAPPTRRGGGQPTPYSSTPTAGGSQPKIHGLRYLNNRQRKNGLPEISATPTGAIHNVSFPTEDVDASTTKDSLMEEKPRDGHSTSDKKKREPSKTKTQPREADNTGEWSA